MSSKDLKMRFESQFWRIDLARIEPRGQGEAEHLDPAFVMSKRREPFRPYQHVDPGGRPVKTCELCSERPASRYTPFTKPDGKTGRMRTCGECADAMPATKNAETGEWVLDIDPDA
jgi:hypothetical protein